MIIQNKTTHVIVLENKHFSREIPIEKEIHISPEEFANDRDVEISFFSFKKEKHVSEAKIERGLRGIDMWLETESDIPLITKANIEGCQRITLYERSNSFLFMYWKFRITNLKSIVIKSESTKKQHSLYSFHNKSDRKKFLTRTTVEASITMLIAIAFFITMCTASHVLSDILIYAGIGACFLASAVRKILYLFKAKSWGVRCH